MTVSKDKLVFLWSTGDRGVALNMIFMYLLNARRNDWWDEVTLLIWGPSAQLIAEDEEIQGRLKKLKEEGVVLEACKACAENYGVDEDLADLGIDVYYIGKRLTEYVKEGRRILSL